MNAIEGECAPYLFKTDYKYAIWENYIVLYKIGNEYVEIYRVVNRFQDITRIFY